MRAFVAVEISEPVRQQIRELLSRLQQAKVRWVKPEQMHLTLAFLGEVSEQFIGAAGDRLNAAVCAQRVFSCRLAGLGAFPSPARARVVWIGMDEGKEELKRLQAAVVQELSKLGYTPEKRPFSPHLTLGRLRFPQDLRSLCQTEFGSELFEVGKVVLFQSILRPEGPEYRRLTEVRLGTGLAELA